MRGADRRFAARSAAHAPRSMANFRRFRSPRSRVRRASAGRPLANANGVVENSPSEPSRRGAGGEKGKGREPCPLRATWGFGGGVPNPEGGLGEQGLRNVHRG